MDPIIVSLIAKIVLYFIGTGLSICSIVLSIHAIKTELPANKNMPPKLSDSGKILLTFACIMAAAAIVIIIATSFT